MKEKLEKYNLILASKSPRRQFLLKELGLPFEIRTTDTDESFPKNLKGKQIALYLCKKKADAFRNKLKPNDLLITADTIVWINNKVLNKPANYKEAVNMLKILSGKMHIVYTAVCISSPLPEERGTRGETRSFVVSTKVFFKKLTDKEIDFYIRSYKPYDKAGAYGAQECLPAGMNPCSEAEIRFLKKLKKIKMIKNSMNTKAGIGYAGIKKIIGSYFNVMGLPMKELY
ncbi:MAG: septum formation protein Maf, partial [Bacteroidetes bacterium]